MKLLLTSAGLSNQSIINSLSELSGKPFSELNVAFVPTASNVESGDKGWLIDDLIVCKNIGFKSVDIVDISAIPKDMWLPRIQMADILYFEGGNSFYLMYWLDKSGLKELLPEMLKTKIFVGVSAGSMVACKSLDMSTSERSYSDEIIGWQSDEGLGFVDILIRPHLNNPYLPDVNLDNLEKISQEFTKSFYAIDDDTAIKVVDGKIEIVSEGVWKKFN